MMSMYTLNLNQRINTRFMLSRMKYLDKQYILKIKSFKELDHYFKMRSGWSSRCCLSTLLLPRKFFSIHHDKHEFGVKQ